MPLVQGGMQWVGVPQLVTAVSNAGGLGLLTALTQPSPDALREAIRETRKNLRPGVNERSKYGGFGVNITILPSINPPDYEGYTRAALEEGVRIFETAGSNPGPIIKAVKEYGGYVIHKCTTVRHARSAQKLGADMLSIDGFECAGHPGEDDIGGLVLMARASEELSIPFIASGGIANGQGLAAALALGACGANMGTRFMCTKEADIHENVKRAIVESDERQTVHMFRTLRNTARVFKNKVAMEVVELEKKGAKFPEIREFVLFHHTSSPRWCIFRQLDGSPSLRFLIRHHLLMSLLALDSQSLSSLDSVAERCTPREISMPAYGQPESRSD